MRAIRSTCLVAATIILILPSIGIAKHHETKADERRPWDQAAMQDLTTKLSRAMRDLRRAYRSEPTFRDQNSPNRHAALRMDESLQQLERNCTQLASRVAGGAAFEETQGVARRIGMLLNDVDMWSRRLMSSAWTDERVRPAMKLINEIAPFYGSGPLFDPETMERVDRAPNPKRRQPDSPAPSDPETETAP